MSGAAPRPCEWFYVATVLFLRPWNSEARTFAHPVGECVEARRCGVITPYEGGMASVYPVGEREWVRVSAIGETFTAEADLYRHLWPELYPTTVV